MLRYKNLAIAIGVILFISYITYYNSKQNTPPIIAIANYGPHSSLTDTITGIKQQLAAAGYIENKDFKYEISDVNFDSALIPQMVSKMKFQNPIVIVALATPVAQYTKSEVKNIPVVFSAITDPVEAGLIKQKEEPDQNITGASDQQNFSIMLTFAKQLMPEANRVGLLYSTSEANDLAMVKMLNHSADKLAMKIIAIPIDQSRDIAMRMQGFAGKVDFIYVGSSGPIQPALPVIAVEAAKMKIPIINLNEEAVKQNMVLASYGVDYLQVGKNTGKIIALILKGEKIASIKPLYPEVSEHKGHISKKQADKFGITIPTNLTNVKIEE